jgi:hypothetical protein
MSYIVSRRKLIGLYAVAFGAVAVMSAITFLWSCK